jgi:outer membrane protein assembly factor BamD
MEKKRFLMGFLWVLLLVVSACKSEFERIRTSSDPKEQLDKAQVYFKEEEWIKSQTLFEGLISSMRGKKESEDIYYKYAYTFYHSRNYVSASYHFKTFANTYGASPLREEAEFMSAYCNYKQAPTFRLDQSFSERAIQELEYFVNAYPDSKKVKECNSLIDELRARLEEKAMDEAKLYYHMRYYQSAVTSFETLLKEFPETKSAELVRLYIIRADYELANNSVLDKREDRYKETKRRAADFMERYPKSENLREVQNIQDNANKQLKLLSNVGYQNQSAGG